MNASRGRLRTVLNQELWKRAEIVLRDGKKSPLCRHWEKTFANYFHALYTADVYPLDLKWAKTSVSTILARLATFCCPVSGCCSICRVHWAPVVEHAVDMTEGYFDGLCIDCMGASRLKKGERPDEKYWAGNAANSMGRWDGKCRVRHGQPSWYHSWCGRDEHRQTLMRRAKED